MRKIEDNEAQPQPYGQSQPPVPTTEKKGTFLGFPGDMTEEQEKFMNKERKLEGAESGVQAVIQLIFTIAFIVTLLMPEVECHGPPTGILAEKDQLGINPSYYQNTALTVGIVCNLILTVFNAVMVYPFIKFKAREKTLYLCWFTKYAVYECILGIFPIIVIFILPSSVYNNPSQVCGDRHPQNGEKRSSIILLWVLYLIYVLLSCSIQICCFVKKTMEYCRVFGKKSNRA